ncbi:UVI-1 protein [Rutstroemia sp. NJR-2017a BVV2]|nr:UVI-1 protein [Rutstroemia sp. NJR-2017a BVV2]
MQGTPNFTILDDEKDIANAFREFVKVHQALLNILIGKAGLFNTVPLIGQPVAQVLRSLEGVVDTIALGLINSIDDATVSASMTADAGSLKGSVTLAISTYSGLQV